MNSYKFAFSPLKLWADSLTFLIIFSSLILGTFFSINQPFGIILSLSLLGVLAISLKKTIRNLYRNLKKQPAIKLTEEYFFDHINNIKIYWHNIIKINMISPHGNTYVAFILKDKKKYSEQLESVLERILFRIPDPDEMAIKTELSLVKGKNTEIYELINKFHQSKKEFRT